MRCASVLYILLNLPASLLPEMDERDDEGVVRIFVGSLGVVAPVPAEDGIVEGVRNPLGSEGVVGPASACAWIALTSAEMRVRAKLMEESRAGTPGRMLSLMVANFARYHFSW